METVDVNHEAMDALMEVHGGDKLGLALLHASPTYGHPAGVTAGQLVEWSKLLPPPAKQAHTGGVGRSAFSPYQPAGVTSPAGECGGLVGATGRLASAASSETAANQSIRWPPSSSSTCGDCVHLLHASPASMPVLPCLTCNHSSALPATQPPEAS